mmetsp:Transcript_12550/g.21131  ORF Transcript_12550/g.21131 Transcript_12550/m.21131 type:complete len:199 (-) Transcript_12550:216-812(-)
MQATQTNAVETQEELLLDLTEDMYAGSLPAEAVQPFSCFLCFGVVQAPVKCQGCHTLICRKCYLTLLENLKTQKNTGYFRHAEGPKRRMVFMCPKCESREATMRLDSHEQQFLDALLFECQNEECEERVAYANYVHHLKNECKLRRYRKVVVGESTCRQKIYFKHKGRPYNLSPLDLRVMFKEEYDGEERKEIDSYIN